MTDRKAHWERIYSDQPPTDVSWYQQEPMTSLSLIRGTGIGHEAPIIDVGGGASVLVDYLYRDGYNYITVLDISARAIAHAKRRLGETAARIEWIEEDVTRFRPRQHYALWHDRAVFHFLTDAADRADYIKVLSSALLPGGHLVIAAFAIGGPDKCSGLDIVQYDAGKMKDELGDAFELLEQRDETHLTPANKEQKFSYFRFNRN